MVAARAVQALIFCLAASAAVPAGPAAERTLFESLSAADPAREIVQTVLDSRFYSLRDAMTSEEWTGRGYAAAWERARRYFPGQTYYVRPGTYFMTHGFDADGRLFMEIHESAYLALCVANRRTFTSGSIVEDYARMRAAASGLEAAGFEDKVGRLAPFFRDETAHRRLRKALGGSLYGRLIEALREEDYHMLAAGLMHEGLHAGLDDALVARLQYEFNAGAQPVQWDELRSFTAEIGYHARFCAWAAGDVGALWREAGASLAGLEAFRKTAARPAGAGEARLERIRARAWAQAALIRLRAREIWQSAERALDLAKAFRRDYVKGAPPEDVEGLIRRLEGDASGFAAAAGEAIQETELAVRSLEQVLDTWGAWAAGQRPFPPPVTDSRAVAGRAGAIHWPMPAEAAATALMTKAAEALARDRAPA